MVIKATEKRSISLTKSNSGTNFQVKIVDFFGIWPMCLLFFSYQESRFPASTAVATSVNPASQTKVKQAEDAHFQRGMYNTEVGLYDYAIAKFQEVLKLHPAHSAAHCRMGVVYCLKNMLNEAADAYQHALTVRLRETRTK